MLGHELFGYEKDAFRGAKQSRAGKIELAHGGTLFLDELESISRVMQRKLLRVIETQKVQRLAGSTSIHVDVRVITATVVPLGKLVVGRKMHSDFYDRVNVASLHLMPLRRRKDDIPLLVHEFLHRHPIAAHKGIASISQPAMRLLRKYSWPGNIRELHNVLERAIVLTTGRVIEHVELHALN